MPLSIQVIAQRGKLLMVHTDFGYGWREYNAQQEVKKADVPESFYVTADEFWQAEGKLVAVAGRVIHPGHRLDGFQLCALPVSYLEIDFEERTGNYHLMLTPERGQLTNTHAPPHFESVVGRGYPEFRGYASSITLVREGRALA